MLAALAVVTLVALAAVGAGTTEAEAAGPPQLTVEPAADLENQVVRLRWSGFPESDIESTNNFVWVYQCKANPKSLADCYQEFRPPSGPDSGTAFFDGVTDADGNGSDVLEVRGALDLPELDCSASNPCSVVAYPVGTDPIGPGEIPPTAAIAPLEFAPSPADCPPVNTFDVRTEGEASLSHAVYRWSAATCTGDRALTVDYTESSADGGRKNFLAGSVDVGLVSRGAGAEAARARPHVAAPVAATGVAIAFNVSDVVTGRPISDMKLTPRLVALLIAGHGNGPGTRLFTDPEFLALNPGHAWPPNTPAPLLRAEKNDDTYLITRWLQEDPSARRFLNGDEPGVPVDRFWADIPYPTDIFEARNPNTIGNYNPRNGTATNIRRLFNFQAPGDGISISPLNEGLLGIVDLVTARKFGLPTADLVPANRPGAPAVAATNQGLAAGIEAMKPDASAGGTLQADVQAGNGAYPLVKVDYALAPTQGLDPTKAGDIARFLEYAATDGQQPEVLADGYLPLTPELVDANETAAAAVLAGAGTPPTTPPADGTSSGFDLPFDTGTGDFGDLGSDFGDFGDDSFTAGDVPGDPGDGSGDDGDGDGDVSDAESLSSVFLGSQGQFVMPVLLGLGLLALIAGPTLFWVLQPRKRTKASAPSDDDLTPEAPSDLSLEEHTPRAVHP